MTLVQLRYLVGIVDADLSVSRAAKKLFATQPGISKQLRSLETELGFQIFHRRGRSLDSVTPAGEMVIERARLIVNETANIRILAREWRSQ